MKVSTQFDVGDEVFVASCPTNQTIKIEGPFEVTFVKVEASSEKDKSESVSVSYRLSNGYVYGQNVIISSLKEAYENCEAWLKVNRKKVDK